MKWTNNTYLWCIPLCFGVCLSSYWIFWHYCITTVTSFIRRSKGWSFRSSRVLDQSQRKCCFFRRNLSPLQIFSAPTQEGNLFFLSKRSARKKLYNFPIKSSHLCRTSRHVWLSSSACDHCCAYQLICIMTISTYTTGARTPFFTVQEPSWRAISALAPVV